MNKIYIKDFFNYYQQKKIIYCPNPGNTGDGLIAYATYSLFKELKMDYRTVHLTDNIHPEQTIVYGGGGNLIEGVYDEAINFIKRHLDSCAEMIILPHTILGYSDFFANCPDKLKIICRERESYYSLLSAGFAEKNLYIDHDLSFYLRDEKIINPQKAATKERIFNCFRADNEKITMDLPDDNFDVSLTWNGAFWHNKHLAKYSTLSVASYLRPYSTIKTNRLHVAILGLFLNKKVFLYPNKYFKNKAIYEYSIKDQFDNAQFIESL